MIWLIYCWHDRLDDDHPSYLAEIKELARRSKDNGTRIRIERIDFVSGQRLWNQIADKTFELMTSSGLSLSDRCAFIISHSLLPGDTYLKEDAYISDHIGDYPKGTFPCIGLMYL